mgnify:CR=1 FL=1
MKRFTLAALGAVLGLILGLIFTWFIQPVEYYNTYPPLMGVEHRRVWIGMTVKAYGAEEIWERTQVRLVEIPEDEIRRVATDELERAVSVGEPLTYLRRISELAQAYGVTGPAVQIYGEGEPVDTPTPLPTVPSPIPSPRPTNTPLPSPTRTPSPLPPTPTPASTWTFTPSLRIISQTLTCTVEPRITVSIEVSGTLEEDDEAVWTGDPMREIWLMWDGGADRALTGFRPEEGLGYADFVVEPGRTYNLYVDSPTGVPILTLQAEPCAPDEGEGWTSRWLLIRDYPPPPLEPTGTPEATEPPDVTDTPESTETVAP